MVLVAITLASITWLAWDRLNPSRVEQAVEVLTDLERFRTATSSGVAFARVASLMKTAGEECVADQGAPPRCDGFFTASATAQVTAATVLRCTRPGVFDARRNMIAYLQALEEGGDPQPPALPKCD